ncbi:MAG: glycosyltransferase [Candidatus Omnitrophica bacterium]|nr:glycosyltransferase [Candidatus Omnitrophota bacterium]
MRLAVISYKTCWISPQSPTGYATDGGFPLQMQALAQLFSATEVLVPCSARPPGAGEMPLSGKALSVTPLTRPPGRGGVRKGLLLYWLVRNSVRLVRALRAADAVHTPVPGDIPAAGMIMAFLLRKRLFVRYCGNWFVQRTWAEKMIKKVMERTAGGIRVMLATGAGVYPPSANRAIQWIFASTLTERELRQVGQPRVYPQDGVRLIIVGRQETTKGTDVLIRSVPLLKQIYSQVCVEVVGDGAALGDFQQLARELSLESEVRFHGRVDHAGVLALLSRATVFCCPTVSEGFPKSVHEALACGLPVVATRVGALPYLIGRGNCGVLIERAVPEEVTAAVQTILADEQQYQEMSARAVRTASAYSLERWRDRIRESLTQAWGALSKTE